MQRRASSSYGATIAPVGQASMHAVQLPQCAVTGASAAAAGRCRSRPGRSTSRASRVSSSVCLPRQPSPAFAASATSITGALSVNTR